jgi:tetratricopeptide (TPR) repeat protein
MAVRKPAPKARPHQEPKTQTHADSRRVLFHALALFALAFAVYSNTLANGFVTDDNLQVLKNPLITDFHKIPVILSGSVMGFMGKTNNFYRPVHLLVYMLLYSIAGFNPAVYHAAMVLLHALSTVLVYFLVRRMLRPVGIAVAAAAVFAVHPIHTEVVNWVAAVPDALLTPIVIGAFWLFLVHGAAPRGMQIAAHGGLYLLAMFTKEPGVMLLPLYVGYEWICLGRRPRDLRRNWSLYAAMVSALCVYLACRVAALGSLAPAQQQFHHVTPVQFVLSVIVYVAQYFWKLLLPASLQYYYEFEPVRGITLPLVASLAAITGLGVLAFRWTRHEDGRSVQARPTALVAFGVFWIAVTLAPALNLTGIGHRVFGERYLYLPSVGYAWIAAMAWYWWKQRASWTAWVAGVLILAVFATQVVARNADWHDNTALLEKSIRQTPSGAELHGDLALEYAQHGDRDRSIAEARTAVALAPHESLMRLNLGNLLLPVSPSEAVPVFQQLIHEQPGSADAHHGLGLAWKATGNIPEATAEFERALAIQPNHSWAMLVLSGIYRDSGRTREAIDLCLQAAATRPRDAEPHLRLAQLYLDSRQYDDVIRASAEALRLEPGMDGAYVAHYYLGIASAQKGSHQTALAELSTSLRLNPGYQPARDAYEQEAASGASPVR